MKKCPFCGYENDDAAWRCDKCKAGFPHEEKKPTEPVRGSKRKNNKESE